jgi:uncharacterized protein (DUF1501 family)
MKHENCNCEFGVTRRAFLKSGAAGFGAIAATHFFLNETVLGMAVSALTGVEERYPNRILVVLELTGGNDGLNTVVPYTNDQYYKLRPTLAIQKGRALKINDEFGFHPNLLGFEYMFKQGQMAVVHGCSYPKPNRSHFESMGFWHTGVPNGADSRGWVGRFADAYSTQPKQQFIINIAKEQSMAVKSGVHAPVVFSDPERFVREASEVEKEVFAKLGKDNPKTGNESLAFLRNIAATADASSDFVRRACAEYRTKMDYGYGPVGADMKRILALIKAGSPARFYYLNFGSFDTHVSQAAAHSGLFNQLGDAMMAFLRDLKSIGRENDVAVMAFTEFGRRVKENASFGTDHGVASPMFVFGHKVKGGFYGEHPSLTDLDEGDLRMTTDFRSVYATMIKEWMGYEDSKTILKGDFPTLGVFA